MSAKTPTSEVVPSRSPLTWLAWLVPAIALVAAVVLAWQAMAEQGPRVTIAFADGRGIRPGDPVMHRGVRVGQVESVGVSEDLSAVRIEARLTHDARGMAREGTRFWIVRPELSLQRVTGLETLIGSRYIAAAPGDGPRRTRFVGMEDIPLDAMLDDSALQIVLLSPRRGSVEVGAPVYYRDVRVGVITGVTFSGDRRHVEMRAAILPEHATLVRANSRFWESTGIGIDAGLFGFELQTGTLDTILAGGVGFATPTRPGGLVLDGHRFDLAPKPEESWFEWAPDLSPAPAPVEEPAPGERVRTPG